MRFINPSYYQGKRGYQHYQMVLDFGLDYFLGVATKYLVRCGKKNPRLEDLTKAKWYILRFMMEVEELPPKKPELSPQDVSDMLGVGEAERLAVIFILNRKPEAALMEVQKAIDAESKRPVVRRDRQK